MFAAGGAAKYTRGIMAQLQPTCAFYYTVTDATSGRLEDGVYRCFSRADFDEALNRWNSASTKWKYTAKEKS